MTSASRDEQLEVILEELTGLDPEGTRIGRVLRSTFDQLYDGQRTGRYRWDQLYKTEKTHCGTLVEINLQREFRFDDGIKLDYCIAGTEVDCKYSQSIGGWMIPTEAMGHICMLVWASDRRSTWSMGLIRIDDRVLTKGRNRDAKRSITAQGRRRIRWVFHEKPLPPNILLQLPEPEVERLMSLPSGQQRVTEIFRVAQNMRIGRGVIATLAQQVDYMKRVRGNGGARSQLRQEGILVLGQFHRDQDIAKQLGAVMPREGEFVSVRVHPDHGSGHPYANIGGRKWRVARDSDPIVPAPELPPI